MFSLLQRFHTLTSSEKFATYSTDLQAIELNRTQDIADRATDNSVEQLMPKFQHLVSELMA